jgi:hypothetical protein
MKGKNIIKSLRHGNNKKKIEVKKITLKNLIYIECTKLWYELKNKDF